MILKNKIYSADGFCKLLGITPILKSFIDHCEFIEYLSRELPLERFVSYYLDDEDFLNEWCQEELYIPVRAYSNQIRLETKYYKVPERLEPKVIAKLMWEYMKRMDKSNADLYLIMGRHNCKSMMTNKILNTMSKSDRSRANELMTFTNWRVSSDYYTDTDTVAIDVLSPSVLDKINECYLKAMLPKLTAGTGIIDYHNEAQDKRREEVKEMIKDYDKRQISDVIFNPPATIVFWRDGSKTVVKAQDGESFDKEKGLAMAYVKKCCGNLGNYNDIFRKWCEDGKEEKKENN